MLKSYKYLRVLYLHPHKAMYLQVLEADGSSLRALLNRGTAYRHLGQYEDAKKDLVKARKSKIVWIELEMEMRALKQTISGKICDDETRYMRTLSIRPGAVFRNDNYPQLPLRSISFERWLKSNDQTILDEIWYPDPVVRKKHYYRAYTARHQLDMAIYWLDVDVAERLLNLQQFDVSQKMYLIQLCSGSLGTRLGYAMNQEKFKQLVTMLCQNDDIDLESRDNTNRTALAYAIKHQMSDLGTILLRYGANANDDSVKKVIGQNLDAKAFIAKNLNIIRKNNIKAIEEVLGMKYRINNAVICTKILNFAVSEPFLLK